MHSYTPRRVMVSSPSYILTSPRPVYRIAGHKRQGSGYSMASTCTPPTSTSIAHFDHDETLLPSQPGTLEAFQVGSTVHIGDHAFLCNKALGKGSFGEVWEGEEDGVCVAMKDVVCKQATELDQALLEVSLLKELHGAEGCVPECLGHTTQQRPDGTSVVRFAMTRIPGEPLEDFFSAKPCLATETDCALHRAVDMTAQLVTQLGRSLTKINERVWHRDVNPRNVLISDAVSGKGFDAMHGDIENIRFGLIDFGLAVDSRTWSAKWKGSSIAGDCRYWPASSWMMSFHGSQALAMEPSLLNQYHHQLDSYALGVLALELLCGSLQQSSTSELPKTWQHLLTKFGAFHGDMHRWNKEVNSVFSSGGNPHCLRQRYQREGVATKVWQHAAAVRQSLRECASGKDLDVKTANLLRCIAELLDENSSLTSEAAAEAVLSAEPVLLRTTAPPSRLPMRPAVPHITMFRPVVTFNKCPSGLVALTQASGPTSARG